MSARDQPESSDIYSQQQPWLFPSYSVSLGDLPPSQLLHPHNQSTSNFGFPAPHLLPRSASAGVPVFALPTLPSLPQPLLRYTSVSTLRSAAGDVSADLQLGKSTNTSTCPVLFDKARGAIEWLHREREPSAFVNQTWSNGTRAARISQLPTARRFSAPNQRDSQQVLSHHYCGSTRIYSSSTSTILPHPVSVSTLENFTEEPLQSDPQCALTRDSPRPPSLRSTSMVTGEGFIDIPSQRHISDSLGCASASAPLLRHSISAKSHRELFFSHKQLFQTTYAGSSSCLPRAAHRPALTRSLSVGNYTELRGSPSTWKEPLFVDLEKRPNFGFVFPGNISPSTPLLYQSQSDHSLRSPSHKSAVYVPLFIAGPTRTMSNQRTMPEMETARCHGSELSAGSCDAVNGGSAEEAAIPPTTEPVSPPRDPRVYFVSSQRHTGPLPLSSNHPVDFQVTPTRSPLQATGTGFSFFRRLRNKIFRRRPRRHDVPPSPQSTAPPPTSLARQVIRRASAMNLFAARQRSQVELASIPPVVTTTPPTSRARRLEPLRSETPDPIDVGSVLAFGGRMRRRSSRAPKPRVDRDTKEAGASTTLSPEQLNRRRNRMTVVAGNQTFVGGEPAKPLQWKWTEGNQHQEAGDDWHGDRCSAPHRLSGTGSKASTHAVVEALSQLTGSAPGDILSMGIVQDTVPQTHGAEDQLAVGDSDSRSSSETGENEDEGFVEGNDGESTEPSEDSEIGQLMEQDVDSAEANASTEGAASNYTGGTWPSLNENDLATEGPIDSANETEENCTEVATDVDPFDVKTAHTRPTFPFESVVSSESSLCVQSSRVVGGNSAPKFKLTVVDFDKERSTMQKENREIE